MTNELLEVLMTTTNPDAYVLLENKHGLKGAEKAAATKKWLKLHSSNVIKYTILDIKQARDRNIVSLFNKRRKNADEAKDTYYTNRYSLRRKWNNIEINNFMSMSSIQNEDGNAIWTDANLARTFGRNLSSIREMKKRIKYLHIIISNNPYMKYNSEDALNILKMSSSTIKKKYINILF